MVQNNSTGWTGAEIEPHLLHFLRGKVNTFVKWDLVRFFHDNPHLAETAENIAQFTGRRPGDLVDELDELADDGVLQRKRVSGVYIYTLASDDLTRTLVEQFVTACDDRQFRIEAINQVIREMQQSLARS